MEQQEEEKRAHNETNNNNNNNNHHHYQHNNKRPERGIDGNRARRAETREMATLPSSKQNSKHNEILLN